MSVTFETPKRRTPDVNLTAMIDISFILVIFVVLAANFERVKALDVSLPEAEATAPADPRALSIRVAVEGPLAIDGVEVPLDEARGWLEARRDDYDSVLLALDRDASVQRAVAVLDAVRGAGFESVGIATEGQP